MAVGLYSQLNVSGIVQLLILMTSITIVTTSTIWLFYYRAQVVLPENHRLKHGTKGMFIFMVTLLVGNLAAGLHVCFLFVQGQSEDAMKEEYYRVRGETSEKNGPVCELRIISAVFESHSSRAVLFVRATVHPPCRFPIPSNHFPHFTTFSEVCLQNGHRLRFSNPCNESPGCPIPNVILRILLPCDYLLRNLVYRSHLSPFAPRFKPIQIYKKAATVFFTSTLDTGVRYSLKCDLFLQISINFMLMMFPTMVWMAFKGTAANRRNFILQINKILPCRARQWDLCGSAVSESYGRSTGPDIIEQALSRSYPLP